MTACITVELTAREREILLSDGRRPVGTSTSPATCTHAGDRQHAPAELVREARRPRPRGRSRRRARERPAGVAACPRRRRCCRRSRPAPPSASPCTTTRCASCCARLRWTASTSRPASRRALESGRADDRRRADRRRPRLGRELVPARATGSSPPSPSTSPSTTPPRPGSAAAASGSTARRPLAGLGSWAWDARRNAWTWSERAVPAGRPGAGVRRRRTGRRGWPPSRPSAARRSAPRSATPSTAQSVRPPLPPAPPGRQPAHRAVPRRARLRRRRHADGDRGLRAGRHRAQAGRGPPARRGRAGAGGARRAAGRRPGRSRRRGHHVLDAGPEHEAFHQALANVLDSAGVRLRAEAEIAEQAAARGRLVAQALDAEDRTRREISEMLHDGPLQDLLALNQAAAAARRAGRAPRARPRRASAARSRRCARSWSTCTRWRSRSPGWSRRSGPSPTSRPATATSPARCRIDPAAGGLRDDLVIALVRELLTNAAKHAGASSVRVELRRAQTARSCSRSPTTEPGSPRAASPRRCARATSASPRARSGSRRSAAT